MKNWLRAMILKLLRTFGYHMGVYFSLVHQAFSKAAKAAFEAGVAVFSPLIKAFKFLVGPLVKLLLRLKGIIEKWYPIALDWLANSPLILRVIIIPLLFAIAAPVYVFMSLSHKYNLRFTIPSYLTIGGIILFIGKSLAHAYAARYYLVVVKIDEGSFLGVLLNNFLANGLKNFLGFIFPGAGGDFLGLIILLVLFMLLLGFLTTKAMSNRIYNLPLALVVSKFCYEVLPIIWSGYGNAAHMGVIYAKAGLVIMKNHVLMHHWAYVWVIAGNVIRDYKGLLAHQNIMANYPADLHQGLTEYLYSLRYSVTDYRELGSIAVDWLDQTVTLIPEPMGPMDFIAWAVFGAAVVLMGAAAYCCSKSKGSTPIPTPSCPDSKEKIEELIELWYLMQTGFVDGWTSVTAYEYPAPSWLCMAHLTRDQVVKAYRCTSEKEVYEKYGNILDIHNLFVQARQFGVRIPEAEADLERIRSGLPMPLTVPVDEPTGPTPPPIRISPGWGQLSYAIKRMWEGYALFWTGYFWEIKEFTEDRHPEPFKERFYPRPRELSNYSAPPAPKPWQPNVLPRPRLPRYDEAIEVKEPMPRGFDRIERDNLRHPYIRLGKGREKE